MLANKTKDDQAAGLSKAFITKQILPLDDDRPLDQRSAQRLIEKPCSNYEKLIERLHQAHKSPEETYEGPTPAPMSAPLSITKLQDSRRPSRIELSANEQQKLMQLLDDAQVMMPYDDNPLAS